jgi:hypothetical protein
VGTGGWRLASSILGYVQDVRVGSSLSRLPSWATRRSVGSACKHPYILGYEQDERVGSDHRRPPSLASCRTSAWAAAVGALHHWLRAGRARGQRPQAPSILGYMQDERVGSGRKRPPSWLRAGRARGQRPQVPSILASCRTSAWAAAVGALHLWLRAGRARGQRPQAPSIFGYVQDARGGSGRKRPASLATCRTSAWAAAASTHHLCYVQDERAGCGRKRPPSLATCRTRAWAAAASARHLWLRAGRARGQRP